MRFVRAIVEKLDKDYFNVSLNREAEGAVIMIGGIVLFQVNAWKFVSLPIFWYFIMFLEDLEKVVGMFYPHILNPKVINYKETVYVTPGVFP